MDGRGRAYVEGLVQGELARSGELRNMKPIRQIATLAILGAVLGFSHGCIAPRHVHVSGFQGGEPFHVSTSRSARIEALSLALLESSGYENDVQVANPDKWSQYEARDHVAITFKPPRDVRVLDKPLAITELMIPISKDRTPPYIFVRSDGGVRAFCKYGCQMAMPLQAELSNGRD